MRYRIERTGVARFADPAREHHVQLRVAPWDGELQRVTRCRLEVEPAVEVAAHRDGFGNQVHRLAVIAAHDRLVTRLSAEVETLLANPFEFEAVAPARETEWIGHALHQAPRLWDFVLHRSPMVPQLPAGIGEEPAPLYGEGRPLLGQVQGLVAWIGERFEADLRAGPGPRPLARLLEERRGAPADLAHLLIALLRRWGIPARYVQGYLDPRWFEPDTDAQGPDAEPLEQRMHPWTEVLIPGAGWRGFDPTHGLLADQTFIRVAVGREAGDVRSERSTYKGGGDAETTVEVAVTRLG